MCQWSEHFPEKQVLHYNEPYDGSLLPEIWAGNVGTVSTTYCLSQLHIQITERKNYQPRILYQSKLSFKSEEETKTFPDKQKLR